MRSASFNFEKHLSCHRILMVESVCTSVYLLVLMLCIIQVSFYSLQQNTHLAVSYCFSILNRFRPHIFHDGSVNILTQIFQQKHIFSTICRCFHKIFFSSRICGCWNEVKGMCIPLLQMYIF